MNASWILCAFLALLIKNHVSANHPMENEGMFEGDIAGIDPYVLLDRNAVVDEAQLWPRGVVYYEIDWKLRDVKDILMEAIEEYHNKTCLEFRPRTDSIRDYIKFTIVSGCWSPVGHQGGEQLISLSEGCHDKVSAVHELGHAIGLWHEHSRSDRDEYLEIIWDNIKPGSEHNFLKLKPYENNLLGEEFDYKSIMLYGEYAFAKDRKSMTMKPKKEGVVIGLINNKHGLSDSDVRRINKLYECFGKFRVILLKDPNGNAVIIGVSLMGIYIWYLNSQPSVYLAWDQILNLVHHKRCFGVEHRNSSKVLQTFLEDSHLAKYVYKTSIQQHSFYTKNEGLVSTPSASGEQSESKPPNISVVAVNSKIIAVNNQNEPKPNKSPYQLQESQESLDGLGVYHTDSGYSEVIPSSSSYNSVSDISTKVEKTQSSSLSNLPSQTNSMLSNSINSCNTPAVSTVQSSYSQPLHQNFAMSPGNYSPVRRVSLSDASIHQGSQLNMQESRNLVESKPISSILPVYRQAPDYDTAVKLKYGVQSCSTGDMSTSYSNQPHAMASGSQIDVSRIYSEQQAVPVQSYSQYKNYTDLSHLDVHEISKNINVCDTNVLVRNQDHVSAPSLHPPVHTYSSPDLSSQATSGDVCTERLVNPHMIYQFKPPPPYPYKQRSSSSTPDLSSNHQATQPCSSPDVILQKNLGLNANCLVPSHNLGPNFQVVNSYPVQYHPQKSIAESYRAQSYEPTSVSCAKIVTSNAVPHQTIASSQKVGSQSNLPVHTYQNINPTTHLTDTRVSQFTEPAQQILPPVQDIQNVHHDTSLHSSFKSPTLSNAQVESVPPRTLAVPKREDSHTMGPMLIAAMNGLSLSRPDILTPHIEEKRIPDDSRIQALENRLAEGQVFLEFERILKKKPNADFSTAMLPENLSRNRFKDVFPYEENRVRLTPTSENKTGYINASHLSASLGSTQRFYIAAQGPLPNTLYSFWQMVWEHNVSVIVMLTEVQEQGRDKCFPYWPQEDGNKLQIGEFQIVRNFSLSSPTYVTCSISLCHVTSHQQKSVWHIQYTDWPDHSCPQDILGFIAFMSEVDAVRRHATSSLPPHLSSSPIVVHCSAGVGRSGVVVLCDIMLHCLDHNQPVDLPKVLTHLRLQRMLTVQTLAQYKFVYSVLIQYLKNSRLI